MAIISAGALGGVLFVCAYTTEKRFKTFKFEFLVLFLQASEADV